MQSMFKFPLALAVLHQVELGKLQLDQPVRVLKSDRSATFSPLRDEFPEADVNVPLRKIIKLTVETSDNTAEQSPPWVREPGGLTHLIVLSVSTSWRRWSTIRDNDNGESSSENASFVVGGGRLPLLCTHCL